MQLIKFQTLAEVLRALLRKAPERSARFGFPISSCIPAQNRCVVRSRSNIQAGGKRNNQLQSTSCHRTFIAPKVVK